MGIEHVRGDRFPAPHGQIFVPSFLWHRKSLLFKADRGHRTRALPRDTQGLRLRHRHRGRAPGVLRREPREVQEGRVVLRPPLRRRADTGVYRQDDGQDGARPRRRQDSQQGAPPDRALGAFPRRGHQGLCKEEDEGRRRPEAAVEEGGDKVPEALRGAGGILGDHAPVRRASGEPQAKRRARASGRLGSSQA